MDWQEADARFAQLPKGRARHGTDVSRAELEAAVRDRRVLVLDRYADGHGGGSICVRMPEPAGVDTLLVEPTRSFQRAVLVFDWLVAGGEDVAFLDRHNAWDTFSEIPGWARLFEERDDSTVRSEAVAALGRLEARHSEPWERAHFLFRSLRLGPSESADELSEPEVAAACSDGPLEVAQRAVLADPHPDGPRLAFAGVCATHDPPRAELIHAQLEMARRRAAGDAGWTTPFRRAKELLEEHGARWAGTIPDLAPKHRFFRGFVEQVTIDAADFLGRAPALYAAAPIRRLHLRRVAPVAEVLFASPHLDRIVGLILTRDRLDDSTVEALAASEHLGRLAWLDLGFNRITRRGYEALLRSSVLPALQYVSVTANPGGDLCEPTGMDHVDSSLAGGTTPAWVADIEREVGTRSWVHLEARLGRTPFPDEY